MAKTRLDVNTRPNTNEENKAVLCKLRSRGKIDSRDSEELTRLFQRLNGKNDTKESKVNKGQIAARTDYLGRELVYGPIEGFPSGSWWGIRMDCSRDKVHSSFNEYVQTGPFGASSICTSHLNIHNDIDFGEHLTFTEEYFDPDILSNDPMVKSYQNRIPIRLVRSYNLNNEFAPKTGYRYDGLYIIASFWIGLSSDSTKVLKFALSRLVHQEPPSWQPSTKILNNISPIRTRTKSSRIIAPRCHMDCCKGTKDKKEKRIERSPSPIKPVVIKKTVKHIPESTIVMRHVSKKCEPIVVPGIESPVQTVNKILSGSPKFAACKLQNTNISIRTDLYDSSSHLQQDGKKVTPIKFCRIFKSTTTGKNCSSATATSTNTNTTAIGPEVKEKTLPKSAIVKSNVVSPVCSEPSSSCMRDQTITTSSELQNSLNETEKIPSLQRSKEIMNSPAPSENVANDSKNSQKPSGGKSRKRFKLSDAVVAIESMSPEQMVNLIVKQRYQTTGKILIGSIIGDPTFVNESMSSSSSSSSSPVSNQAGSVKRKETVQKYSPQKIGNEYKQDRLMRSRRTRVSKALVPIKESNMNKNRKESSSKRQKSSSQNAFSKSTAMKMKKRRSELANLAIDANFTTKTKGPRTRSLRYPTRYFGKRRENLYLKPRQKLDMSKKSKSLGTKKTSTITQRHPETKNKPSNIQVDSSIKIVNGISSLSDNPPARVPTKKPERSKSRMIDAMTQCSIRKDASTLIDFGAPSHYGDQESMIKIERIDLDDVKSETYESDDESPQIVVYRNSGVQTSSPQSPEIVRPNCMRQNYPSSTRILSNSGHGLSAFAPVNVSDVDFRIARLRSIGFKPIDPCLFQINESTESSHENYIQSGSSKKTESTLIAKRIVDEQFNKYASEDNTVVEYMDHELRYQDIEDEESESNGTKMFAAMLRKRKIETVKNKVTEKNVEVKKPMLRSKRKCSSSSVEERENPWHGWKKFVAKDGSFV